MNRLETVKSKYPDIDWDNIKSFDPSKSQKYLGWLGANIAFADPAQLKNLILDFEKKKSKLSEKDINKYSAEILSKELDKLGLSRKEEKLVGAIEVTENVPQGVKIYLIEGEKAAKQYFAHTRWCISNYDTFLNYAKDSNIFVVIKGDTKICVVINLRYKDRSQIFDPQDRSLNRETLEVVSKFGGSESDVLKLMKICEDFSLKNKNFWSDPKKNTENLDKALTLTTVDKVIRVWGSPDTLFCNEDALDKLLKLESVDKIFNSITYSAQIPEKTIKFIFDRRDKYTSLANKFDASKKSFYIYPKNGYGVAKYVTLSSIWKDLLKKTQSNSDNDELLKQIKKLGGLTKLLQNKTFAKLISAEVEKELEKN